MSRVSYLASSLPREGIHQLLDAVVCQNSRVEEELYIGDLISINEEAVRHEWVPVVELAELQGDAIPVLEAGVK